MKNADYWRGRAIILGEAAQKGADVCVDDIADMFRGAERSVQADLERWYGRFAVNNQISLTEARKLLNTSELEEFRWTVEEYVKIAKQEDLPDEWIRKLENASAKFHVSRLEAVQTQIQQHIELLYKSQTDSVESLLKQVAYNSYTYTAYEIQKGIGLGWNITALDEKKLNTLLSKPWTTDKKTFRDRCWEGKADLVSGVQKTLTQGMLRGNGQKKMAEAISKQFGVSRYKAGRLVHTETTYFNAVSSIECYRELGVERVEIIETLDVHTCELCGSMDGKVLPLAQCEPGVTIPPFHPNCRGTTAPAIDEDIIGERAARDEDGEYYTVPSNTTYEQWKAQQEENNKMLAKAEDSSGDNIEWPEKGKSISADEYRKLRSYAEEKGVRLQGFKGSDVDTELAYESISAADTVFAKYPELRGSEKRTFTIELDRNMPSADFGEVRKGAPHILRLNADAFRSKDALEVEYQKLADEGWFVRGTDYKSVIFHEMGHMIADVYGIDGLSVLKDVLGTGSTTQALMWCRSNLSKYSFQQAGEEIISEMYSAYYGLVNPPEQVLDFVNRCDMIIVEGRGK